MAGARRFGRKLTAVIYAVAVHIVVLAVLGLSFDWNSEPAAKQGKPQTEIVRARAVDEAAVEKELARIDEQERAKERAERERLQKLEQAKKEAAEAERRRKAEEARLAKLREEQAEAKRQAAEAEKQRAAEEKRIAEAKRKEEERKKAQAAEKKRKEEEARKKAQAAEKKRKEEEARKKAEAERKRREEEERLQAQLEQEQQEREAQSLFTNEYAPLIRQKVTRNWIKSASFAPDLKCTLAVRVTPGGEVLEARVVRSSGNAIFDRSAENAVLKSTPLPMPTDRELAARMTEFTFIFDPSKQG